MVDITSTIQLLIGIFTGIFALAMVMTARRMGRS